jgi:hypothetical protein
MRTIAAISREQFMVSKSFSGSPRFVQSSVTAPPDRETCAAQKPEPYSAGAY